MTRDLVVTFRVKSPYTLEEAADQIAKESSVATWTEITTMKPRIRKLQAYLIRADEKTNTIQIGYPVELFEEGSIPQLLSDIAGNIFGLKEIFLRLESVTYPPSYIRSFPGPAFGIDGVRKIMGTDRTKRPHLGTIVKPKVGLNPQETAEVAYEAWVGGIDFVKDDENLTDQKFCRFEERLFRVLNALDKAEKETGEKKMYAPNITGNIHDMEKRAEMVKEAGGKCIMMDVLTVGFAAVQHIREMNLGMVIHGHRAMHGAMTRIDYHGMSMVFLASLSRLAGVDQLHVGAIFGKMDARAQETLAAKEELEKKFGGKKSVFSVASGGLSPLALPDVVNTFGKNVVIQAGGGVHGHPGGTRQGARALRQALDAAMSGVPLEEYAKTHEELSLALKTWKKKKG